MPQQMSVERRALRAVVVQQVSLLHDVGSSLKPQLASVALLEPKEPSARQGWQPASQDSAQEQRSRAASSPRRQARE